MNAIIERWIGGCRPELLDRTLIWNQARLPAARRAVGCGAMRAEVFMVANSAAISGWLLNVDGGGWEHYTCGEFPAVVRGALAGICDMDEGDFGTTPSLDFKISTADAAAEVGFTAESIYSLMRRGPAAEGVPSRFPFVQPFEFGIVGSRVMRASVAVGGVELASVTFNVRDRPPQKAIGS